MRGWLIALRNEQKCTAQDVAEQLGISPAYYSMIESGKRQKKMDITLMYGISKVFNIPIEKIVEHENSEMNGA